MRTDSAIDLLHQIGKDARLLIQTELPLNIEADLALLEGAITPIPLFFVRNNSSIPQIAPEQWSLTVDGLVERPFSMSYAELRRLPATSYVAVLQCSGNGRVRFADAEREAEGIQWHNGAVGNAEWVGVSVRLLLERAGVKPGAVQGECIGGDADRTTRGVEITKLMDDAILAYAMNGELLPRIHGGPVRLIVPGWGGINSLKWIAGLHVIDHESGSCYNQKKYVLIDAEGREHGKVREFAVTSVISRPTSATLRAGVNVVRGFAWSPGGPITRVEVSANGGKTWQDARLLADLGAHSWRQWEWQWEAAAGSYQLAVRATDAAGATQPDCVPFNAQGYLMNAIERVPVQVVA